MAHVAEGRLRRLADEPAEISESERAHYMSCARCQGRQVAACADGDAAARALNATAVDPVDVDAAWAAVLDQRREPTRSREMRVGAPRSRARRRAAAVTAAVVAVGAFASTAAASGWLPIFRPDHVTAVPFDVSSVATLPDLSAFGSISAPGTWEPEAATDAAAAAAQSGVPAPTVASLPRGVSGQPTYSVLPQRTATFTFSADRAAAAAARLGRTLPPMPAGIDGSQLRLQIGPGVVETWTHKSGLPVLVVARLKPPVVSSNGISLATLRSYLLAQPGIPAGLAAQLRALPADGSALPIPVPANLATSKATTVNGDAATVIQLRDQSESGVVWVSDGVLDVVFGPLTSQDALDVARGLR